jgi:hypothetical protein
MMNEPTRPTTGNKLNYQYWPESNKSQSRGHDDISTSDTTASFTAAVWEVIDELGNLLITKQSDYGPGNVNNAFGGPMNGLMVRIGDKFERLKNLLSNNKHTNYESVEDSFMDLANYAVIALMVKRGTWPKK